MKKCGIFLAVVISITLVIVVVLRPHSRQNLLLTQLEQAPSTAEKVRIIQEILDLRLDSAREILWQYSQTEPTVAFDPRHAVGLVVDRASAEIKLIGADHDWPYSLPEKLEEVQLRLSNDQGSCFVLLANDGYGNKQYIGFPIIYDSRTADFVYLNGSSNLTPAQVLRWQTGLLSAPGPAGN